MPQEYQDIYSQVSELDLSAAKNGEVVSILKNFGAVVKASQGLLLLKEVQLAGKKTQSGWDFVNGMRVKVGDVVGSSD